MVNSGTEATLSAIRLARGATGRDAIVKLEGCYHGHADSLLVAAGSGVASLAIPGSPGIPKDLASLTYLAPFNDSSALERLFQERGRSVAALILEPVAGNMGVVPPEPGYLETARRVTREAGALLILDEVMTGFRVSYGGAQSLYGIEPDLTTLGKIIGGGLPVGAYGGRADLMDQMAPEGRIYQAGTLSGNPLAMAAGLATLRTLKRTNPYERLEALGKKLQIGLQETADRDGIPLTVQRVGSMLTPFFTADRVRDFAAALRSDTKSYARFFHAMLRRGHYLPPAQFEAFFLSASHTEEDVNRTLEDARSAFQEINR
jgi:glutamate-1-semialdehyde 2,1-aminomutase